MGLSASAEQDHRDIPLQSGRRVFRKESHSSSLGSLSVRDRLMWALTNCTPRAASSRHVASTSSHSKYTITPGVCDHGSDLVQRECRPALGAFESDVVGQVADDLRESQLAIEGGRAFDIRRRKGYLIEVHEHFLSAVRRPTSAECTWLLILLYQSVRRRLGSIDWGPSGDAMNRANIGEA